MTEKEINKDNLKKVKQAILDYESYLTIKFDVDNACYDDCDGEALVRISINRNLERIADALEKIAEKGISNERTI